MYVIYKNIEEQNSNNSKFIAFNDMIADMQNNEKLNKVVN